MIGNDLSLEQTQIRSIADAVVVEEWAKKLYEPVWPKLRAFYDAEGHTLTDAQLAIELDTRFSSDLWKHVCQPAGFYQWGCVFVATILLRQGV